MVRTSENRALEKVPKQAFHAPKKAEILRPKAKEQQKVRKGNQPGATIQKSEKLSPINITKQVAETTKKSTDTVSKVKYIIDKADDATQPFLFK